MYSRIDMLVQRLLGFVGLYATCFLFLSLDLSMNLFHESEGISVVDKLTI